jgi:hypothetical protein
VPSFVASPADAPRNPHKSREPDNLSAMVEEIDSINSATAVAENGGFCWSRWHLAMGLAATPLQWLVSPSSKSLAPRCDGAPGGYIGAIWPPKSSETPILRAFSWLPVNLVFRGRTLLAGHQLARRYAGFSTWDFND